MRSPGDATRTGPRTDFEFGDGDPARTEQDGRRLQRIQDRGFHPPIGRPRVEDQIHPAAQIVHHMPGLGGAGMPEPVRGRRRDGQPGRLEKRLGDRMRGHAHGHRVQSGGHLRRKRVAPRQEQRQRTRPEPPAERFHGGWDLRRHGSNIRDGGKVHDQRIRRRPALRLENPADGGRVEGVRAQAVDGLGRERDQPAADQAFDRALDGGRLRMNRIDRDQVRCGYSFLIFRSGLYPEPGVIPGLHRLRRF